MYGVDQLNQLMATSDYVVMCTPYTPATHQMVNSAAIASMKPTGVFINVGRGKCVDEEALIRGRLITRLQAAAGTGYRLQAVAPTRLHASTHQATGCPVAPTCPGHHVMDNEARYICTDG